MLGRRWPLMGTGCTCCTCCTCACCSPCRPCRLCTPCTARPTMTGELSVCAVLACATPAELLPIKARPDCEPAAATLEIGAAADDDDEAVEDDDAVADAED